MENANGSDSFSVDGSDVPLPTDEVVAATPPAPLATAAFAVEPPDDASDNDSPISPFEQFDHRSIPVDRIVGSIVMALLVIGAIVGLVFLYFAIGLTILFFSLLGSAVVLAGILMLLAIVWPAIEHRNRAWRLTDVGLEVKHGVWWKHQQAIPWARVQHADVSQGPIQRMYGIGTLTVHTAGTRDSAVNFEGLAHEQAVSLRDEVIRQRKSSDVV